MSLFSQNASLPLPFAGKAKRVPEVLDLRHFGAKELRPLLEREAERWAVRLRWNYDSAIELLLQYIEDRALPGFAAVDEGRVVGYGFCVFEASKAVLGDVYAFGEAEGTANPVAELILKHLLEMLSATPALDRIESQLLLFPAGALAEPFGEFGFRRYPRLFMKWDFDKAAVPAVLAPRLPRGLRLRPWTAVAYGPAAELIHRAYLGHMDAGINDQYRSMEGSQRFLHNIIRFPGCGVFDPANSMVIEEARGGRVQGLVLSSRVQPGLGHITQVCLAPELRGVGLGRVLLAQCAANLQRRGGTALSLTVTEANVPAVTLYESLGFRTEHRFEARVWERSSE